MVIIVRYLVKFGELDEKIRFIEEKLDNIYNAVEEIEKAKNSLIWEGVAKDAFILKYDEYVSELKDSAKKILNILLFLKSFYNNYNEEYLLLKKKYSELLSEGSIYE